MPIGTTRLTGRVMAAALLATGCLDLDDDSTTRDDEGAIVEGGELGAFSIQVGDCLGAAESSQIETVEGIPCDEPHRYEVYHGFALEIADDSFPGASVIEPAAESGCLEAFTSFVGVPLEQSIYQFVTITPTVDSWERSDDREVLCLLGLLDQTDKTGSARDTAS
jgi:hypothetical protein